MDDLILFAALKHDIKRVHRILEEGKDPNTADDKGNTALHYLASMSGIDSQDIEKRLQMAEELIGFQADVNVTNHKSMTPLMLAVRAKNCRMVEFLLQANANTINNRDDEGNSAMHYAASAPFSYWENGEIRKQLSLVKTLLKCHPDLDVLNIHTQTPLMIAVRERNFPIVKCLLKHNASVNIVNSRNESVLHRAFRNSVNVELVEELLRNGGDFGLINNKGQTPIDIYINTLNGPFRHKEETAKSVFKIFILLQNTLSPSQQQAIERIRKDNRYKLPQFIRNCSNELKKMLHDELAPNYYVHSIALHGILKRDKNDTVSPYVFDKVIDKVIKGEYPVYRDIVVCGICTRHLRKKFAEICLIENTGGEFLNYYVLYNLSFYLSKSDMLSMMVAFSSNNK